MKGRSSCQEGDRRRGSMATLYVTRAHGLVLVLFAGCTTAISTRTASMSSRPLPLSLSKSERCGDDISAATAVVYFAVQRKKRSVCSF